MGNFNKPFKKLLKGSYTVEGAILIPICFVVLLLAVSYLLIGYDRVAICTGVYEGLVEGLTSYKEEENSETIQIPIPTTTTSATLEMELEKTKISAIGYENSKYLSDFIESVFPISPPELSCDGSLGRVYGEDVLRIMERMN